MEPVTFTREQIERRVARVADMKPTGDLAGMMSNISPELRKVVTSQTVMGLTSPNGPGERNFWDAGAVDSGTANFGAVYVRCNEAGQGASWHVHRYSYENFVALQGRWRILWNAPEIEEHIDLDPFDMVSIPPGAIRRFEYIGEGEGLMMAFAYAGQHSLLDLTEIWLPPCEVERIEDAAVGNHAGDREYAQRMRSFSETVAAAETEEDRKFSREVVAFVNGEAVSA